MGSPLRLVVDARVVDQAWRMVVDRFTTLERQLTRFDPNSPLSHLNRAAGSASCIRIPRVLRRTLVLAHRGYRLTDGRFDPRVVGALEALGDRAEVPLPPSPTALLPGERWLEIDRAAGEARLGAPVDLGGIGKGVALWATAKALAEGGIGGYLVEAGGDVVASGSPGVDEEWKVALEHPDRDLPAAVVRLRSGALCTSSIAVRQWASPTGSVLHHLLDPATGRPATGVRAVTVLARDPAWAEIWSTAAFVSGDRAGELVAGRAAWWIDAGGEVHMTSEAERMTVWR